jgi:hypothetical protein
MAPEHNACLSTSHQKKKPDYFLAACYILIYLELAWLIFVLLRTYYSRD